MATVKILIKGIALTYHKNDGIWRVLFPWEGGHLIKFKENEEEQGMALARKNRGIRITTEGAESSFETGSNYDDFLDLTADYSHKNGVRMKEGWQERAVLMTVENAKFSVNDLTVNEHFLHLDNVVTLAPKKVGYDGTIEIKAKKVTIEVDDHPDFPKTFTEDCTLIFDNDCNAFEPRELSDFAMLYDIVEDVNKPDEQFTVERFTDEMKDLMAGSIVAQQQGMTMRENSGDGVPCHMVQASKSDLLTPGTDLDPEQGVTLRAAHGLPCEVVRASKADLLPSGTIPDPEQGVTLREAIEGGLPCHLVSASKADLLPSGTTPDPAQEVTLRNGIDGGLPCYMVRASKTDLLPSGTTLDPEQGVTLRDSPGSPFGLPCHLIRASKADGLP